MSKKILTLEKQKHIFQTLPTLFVGLNADEKKSIINSLGLNNVVDDDGNPIPRYNLDIISDKSTFVKSDYAIKLSGNLFNYFENSNEDATAWQWSRDSGDSIADEAWETDKTNRELTLSESDFTSRFNTRDVIFTLTVSIGTEKISDKIIFSKQLKFGKVQITSPVRVFTGTTPSSIKFSCTSEGVNISQYRWYLGTVLKSNIATYTLNNEDVAANTAVTIKLEVTSVEGEVYTDIVSIPKVVSGTDGEPGVGEPGKSTYTWIKYADGPNGEGMSEYPFKTDGTAREYIGMAYNKGSATESNNPDDYTWSKYIGNDGVPGENGYMWLKYSLYSTGRDPSGDIEMYDTPFILRPDGEREDMVYLGIAYNKSTKTEAPSNTPEGAPEQYTWSKIKGEDGRTPFTIDLSNDNVSVPTTSDGTAGPTAYQLVYTNINLYYGNDLIDRSEYNLVLTPTNVAFTATDNNHHIQVTNMSADSGQVEVKAMSTASTPVLLATATFSVTKVKGTSIFEIIPSSPVIKVINNPGSAQTVTPASVDVKIMKNSGDAVTQTYEGQLTYRYIFASTVNTDDDGTAIAIDTILTIDNTGDPLFLEFKYFHPVSGNMVDRERIPFVRDGSAGNSIEMRFRVTNSSTVIPALEKTNNNPPNWSVTQPTVPTGQVLWMTKATKTGAGNLIGEWSDPIIFIGLQGKDGAPGISGTQGPSPRSFEWVPGATYQIGGGFMDYIYYRGNTANSSDPCRGWYTVKIPAGHTLDDYNVTPHTAVANASGCPDPTLFEKAPFSNTMTFSTILAEQANLAGFLFRNQVLTSREVGYQTCLTENDRGPFPKLSINGLLGVIKFLERMVLDERGITMKDDCGNPRMLFQWANGVPILQFLDENGKIVWKAGQNGYQVVYIDTRQDKYVPVNAILTSDPLSGLPSANTNEIKLLLRTSFCACTEANPNMLDQQRNVDNNPINLIGYVYERGTDNVATKPLDEDGKIFTDNSGTGYVADGWYIEYLASEYEGHIETSYYNIPSINYMKIVNGKIESRVTATATKNVVYYYCGTHTFNDCV